MAGYTDNPVAQLHAGKYTNGDPVSGIPSSRIMAEQTNSLIDEINNVVTASGGIPNFAVSNQLLEAIKRLASSVNSIIPVSSGATTIVYGYPQCSSFTVDLPDPVDGRVYRFVPHATNDYYTATTLNGKPLMTYSHQTLGVVSEVSGARYKALRPGYVAEVIYRAADDVFIVINPKETEILHLIANISDGATTFEGWTVTRISTGQYRISTGFRRAGWVHVNSLDSNFILSSTVLGSDGNFDVMVRNYSGDLSNSSLTANFLLVF